MLLVAGWQPRCKKIRRRINRAGKLVGLYTNRASRPSVGFVVRV
jgi:hypothetical protein